MKKPKKPKKDSQKRQARRGNHEDRPGAFREDSAGEVLRVLGGHGTGERRFHAGQDLFSPGAQTNAIYLLLNGWVFLYGILENGRRQILHFAMPGAVLGFPPDPAAIATFGAQALTDVTVSIIPDQALRHLSSARPDIGLEVARLISGDLGLAFEHLMSVGRQSARERVARLLLELFMRYWPLFPGPGISALELPLTQEHIGDATGLTAIHVNRVLRGLKQEGIVEFSYRRLRILNPDKLCDVASVDPQQAKSWFQSQRSE